MDGERLLTVFALTRVTLHHLVTRFEARESHVGNRVLFMVSLLRGDNGCEGGEREVDTGKTARLDERAYCWTTLVYSRN